jgi:protein phosphatase
MISKILKRTAKGLVRKRNEDNITVFDFIFKGEDWKCLAVADGIGGHNAGDLASAIAIDILQKILQKPNEDYEITSLIKEIINQMNDTIYERSKEDPDYDGMGTTLTMALINRDNLHVGHVGDSRAYLLRDNNLERLTQDHSIVGELVRSGQITKEEAMKHPRKNLILQAIGLEEDLQIDYRLVNLSNGDYIILCTDGLSDLLSDDEISDVILNFGEENALDIYVDLIVERGAHDNYSIIIAKWLGGDQ